MQQRNIIIFIAVLFFLSSIWLFQAGQKATDPNIGKNFWTLSFSDPKGDSLDFQIENHSDRTDFHFEILKDEQKIKEGNVKLEKGSASVQEVRLLSSEKQVLEKTQFSVRVNAGGEEKEIYKNFDK